MRAGQLRDLATLQVPSDTGDSYSTAGGYQTLATGLRVEVKPLAGRELREAHQSGSEISTEILCRYDSRISSAARLIVDGTTYEVAAPIDLRNRHREMRLQCKVVA